jgi:hypothetical protein
VSGGIFDLYEIVPGFLAALAAALSASLLGPPPREDQIALYDQAQAAGHEQEEGQKVPKQRDP